MAGAGYKLFNTGDVLTAAQVNTYLQEQAVMRFANSTARTTALSGVLAEGMMSYLDDTNSVEVYNGSSWVSVGSTGDITGVTAGTGISGGGTSGDVTITNSMATAIDAKGDLIVGTGADTFSRLAVGTNGHTLVADSATATGLKWAAAGGMTELASGNLPTSATTVTLSSISSGYNDLILVVRDWFFAAAGFINIRFNSDTGNNYGYTMANNNGSDAVVWGADNVLDRIYPHLQQARNADGNNSLYLRVNDYANTIANKTCNYTTVNRNSANTYDAMAFGYGHWLNTNAINAITIFNDGANNFSGGSYILYGVK